jgi:hypothetical protein
MCKCKIKDCMIGASFGYENDKKRITCKKHKEPNMINLTIYLKKNKCICGKNPFFGYKTDKIPSCCSICKKDGMENIIDKKCECGRVKPCFGYINMKAICCFECKKENMINLQKINIIKYKCICGNFFKKEKYKLNDKYCCYSCYIKNKEKKGYCFCGKRASFGVDVPTKCKEHKTDEMIDIKNKNYCCNCSGEFLRKLYGYETDEKPNYCLNCKKDNMIDLHNFNARCKCPKKMIALYGYINDKTPSCCFYCKKEDMRNIRDPICKNKEANCQQFGNKKYKNYCAYCFSHIFKDDPLTLEIKNKTKELQVNDFINKNYDGFIHDKPIYIGNGCDCSNRRRIDFRKIIDNTILAIECDEFQHKRYDKNDEEARYNDMYMIFSGKWYYIRFNPDTYRNKNNKIKNPNMSIRLIELQKTIDNAINEIKENKNDELVKILYLFYDE